MRTIKVLYPNIIDIDCYSHTIDHVGEHFKAPTLEEFIRLWISLFAHSPRTRLAWKELTGRAMSTYSEIRWWSRWEVCNQVLWQFGDVLPFLQPHPEFFSNHNSKACTTLTDPQKVAYLQMELAAVVNCGENFVKATYKLESDGPVVFKCYEIISTLTASIHTALRKMKAM